MEIQTGTTASSSARAAALARVRVEADSAERVELVVQGVREALAVVERIRQVVAAVVLEDRMELAALEEAEAALEVPMVLVVGEDQAAVPLALHQ